MSHIEVPPAHFQLPILNEGHTAECLAESLKSALLTYHHTDQSRTQPFVIDAAAVERITTPAFQILLSSAIWCQRQGLQNIQVTNPSPAFMQAYADLGLMPTYQDGKIQL